MGVIFKYSVFEPGSTIVAESHCGRFIGVTYGASGQFCVVSLFLVSELNIFIFLRKITDSVIR